MYKVRCTTGKEEKQEDSLVHPSKVKLALERKTRTSENYILHYPRESFYFLKNICDNSWKKGEIHLSPNLENNSSNKKQRNKCRFS